MARKKGENLSSDIDKPSRIIKNAILPDSHDPRDIKKKRRLGQSLRMRLGMSPNPSKTDWIDHMNAVRDQGQDGACVGFAVTAAMEALIHKKTGISIDLSEKMAYEYAKRYDEWPGEAYEGTSARGCVKALNKHGVCEESYWPYSIDRDSKPSKLDFLTNAATHKISAYRSLIIGVSNGMNVINPDDVAYALVDSPIPAGFVLTKEFENTGNNGLVVEGNLSDSEMAHAMCIIGYDPVTQLFKIRNSWGPNWADNGYCYIKKDFISKMLFTAWCIEV